MHMKCLRNMLCWALAIGMAVCNLPSPLALAEATVTSAATLEAVLDAELLTPSQRFAFLDDGDPFLFPSLKPAVVLAMADGFGRPAFSSILPREEGSSSGGGLAPMQIRPSLRPSLPKIPTPTPNPLQLLSPEKKEKLKADSKYTLSWTLDSGRKATFDLLLSIDGGETYDYIAKGVKEKKYKWDVPNTPSTKCRLRIDAYVGSARLAQAISDVFTIVKAATPTPKKTATPAPTPVPTPTPTPTPAPNEIINPSVFYRKDGNFFINKAQGGLRWFRVEVLADAAARIVWQVSKVPFTADNGQALSPAGLIATGELASGQTEFAVDFDVLVERLTGKVKEGLGWGEAFTIPEGQVLLDQIQYNFYIRAIALDAAGKLLGDADEGLSTGYGTLLARPEAASHDAGALLVQTWVQETASQHYGQSSVKFMHRLEGIYAHPDDPLWRFEFRDRPANAAAQELQIATTPFAAGAYTDPQGLAYRERVEYDKVYQDGWPQEHMLEFAKFVPSADTLGTSTVTYYVRMVFFVQDQSDPGHQYAVPSEAQIIYYNNLELNEAAAKLQFAPPLRVTVKSGIPFTRFLYYMPVQWGDPNAEEYFQVSRRIMAEENMITVKKNGQVVIWPYPFRQMMGDHTSVEEYQQRLDTYLFIGKVVHISKSDPSVWDEATALLKAIYNGVKAAYDDVKSTVVGFVADNFPLLGDDAREALRRAMEIALDAGLAAIGIPPTLPDFEKLASEGFAYCLEVALEETCKQLGIPESEITQEIRDQVADEYSKKLASLGQSANSSPLSYLKPSSLHCYRPAYFVLIVQNFTDQQSPSGTLVAGYRVLHHFLHFYETARIPIPSLAPGEHLLIKYYWEPKIAKPVADYKPGYDEHYFGNSIKPNEFSLSVTYDVPDAEALALEQGLWQKPSFPRMNYEYVYDHEPVYAYSFQAPPCDFHAEDESVDIMDFYE